MQFLGIQLAKVYIVIRKDNSLPTKKPARLLVSK